MLEDSSQRLLPLLGFEADTWSRKWSLRALNRANRFAARLRTEPIRVASHPRDHRLRLRQALERPLERRWKAISYREILQKLIQPRHCPADSRLDVRARRGWWQFSIDYFSARTMRNLRSHRRHDSLRTTEERRSDQDGTSNQCFLKEKDNRWHVQRSDATSPESSPISREVCVKAISVVSSGRCNHGEFGSAPTRVDGILRARRRPRGRHRIVYGQP